jgi:hypothetical protein
MGQAGKKEEEAQKVLALLAPNLTLFKSPGLKYTHSII